MHIIKEPVKENFVDERLRTANILGALTLAISDKLLTQLKEHSRQNDTSAAALNVIACAGGISNGQLCTALGITHSATVRLLDKLVESSLVEVRTGSDKRAVAIFLTSMGRDRVSEVLEGRSEILGGIVDLLNFEQRNQLNSIAETLLAQFTEGPVHSMQICRLCDGVTCPTDRCPVHLKAFLA